MQAFVIFTQKVQMGRKQMLIHFLSAMSTTMSINNKCNWFDSKWNNNKWNAHLIAIDTLMDAGNAILR